MRRSERYFQKNKKQPAPPLHDFILSIRNLLPVLVLGLIVFTALIPLSTAAVHEYSVFNVDFTHDQLKFRFCAEGMEAFITAAALLSGAAVSMKLFSFMQDKRRAAFYFSLGISRRRLYLIRTAASLLILGLIVVLPMMFSLFLNIRALGAYEGIWRYAAAMALVIFLQAGAGMLIGKAGCFLAGTPGESFLAAAAAAAAPSVLFGMVQGLMKTFLWGNVFGTMSYSGTEIRPGLLYGLSIYNPVCFSYRLIGKYNSFSRSMEISRPGPVEVRPLLAWTVLLILCSLLLYVVFERFRAEKSGIGGLSGVIKAASSIVWPAAAFSIILETLQSIGTWPVFFTALSCAAVLFMVTAEVFSMRRSGPLRKLAGAGGLILCFILCAGLAGSGLFGLYYRIPEADRIESVRITYAGDPSFIPDQCSLSQKGQGIYSSGTVSLRSPQAIAPAAELEKKIQEQGKAGLQPSDNPSETIYPYDVVFTWTGKNGKERRRYYDRIRASLLEEFLDLEETEELKKNMSEAVCGQYSERLWNSETFRSGEIYVSDPWMRSIKHITLSGDMRTELLQAAAEDLSDQTPRERYQPPSDQKGFLYFTLNGDPDLEQMQAGTAKTKIYYTDGFKRTLSLLEEWGALPEEEGIPGTGEILRVQIQKFDPYSGMNKLDSPVSLFFSEYRTGSDEDFVIGQDFGNRPQFTEQGQIGQLAAASVSSSYMTDAGCLALFEMDTGYCLYRYIPMEAEPDFIKEKIN